MKRYSFACRGSVGNTDFSLSVASCRAFRLQDTGNKDRIRVVKLQFLRHKEPLCKAGARSMLGCLIGVTLKLHWHRAPGQTQVLGEANWQSILGLTWLNHSVTQSTPRSSPPHRKAVGKRCYPQIMNFCQNSSLSFLDAGSVVLSHSSRLENILTHSCEGLPGGKLAILLCRARVFRDS